ncbi:hypothetical protein [Brachyspira pilosicoli]|uniref:hypothetical protein n=1 Tax=Brachyspira pilosicoli TaxID=52584 RepID=UPI001CA495EA|nr:hypothetical protein [Brachyspira pilosicoli]MBW5382576.1 hypothetical protein [Brachyspira pilosicoli]
MSDNNTNTENTNNNTNNDNNNTKEKNKSNKKNIIIDFFKRHFSFMLYSIICIIFLLILICKYSKYTNESKTLIENSIKQFELNSQTQLSNYYEFLKETVTNESFESKEFIKNTLEEAFKPNIDLLRETLKDSKDFSINTVTFWLAFLSLIMIIFTILGIYANNKIMESNQKQSELIINETELKSKESIENIRKELSKENKEYIENLKSDFDNIKNNILNEMNTIKTEAINAKDNAINEVNSIKEEINNNKSEAEDLKSEIYKIKDESKKLLEEMKKERKAQKQEGQTILNKMEKRQKVNDLLNKAWSESNKNNKEEAIKFYTEALEIDSKNTIALNNRGILYSNKYKESKEEEYFDKALDDYNKILNTDKNNNDINALNNRGNLYLHKYEKTKEEKYFNKALEDYDKVLSINNNNINALNNRSILYSNKYTKTKGEEEYYNKALLDYNKMLNINKNYYNAYIGISFLYLNHYEVNEKENKESLIQAEKYLNEGLKISPNNLELINNYGIFLYLKNDLNNSEKYLKKAINNSRIKENIGETYYYLHLVYKEYSELDNNNSGYSKYECKKLSNEYLQKSKDLGYKHFMDK